VALTVEDDTDHVGLVSAEVVNTTEPVVPVSTEPALLLVVIVDVYVPAVEVFVSPLSFIDTAVPAAIVVAVNEYVSVPLARETVPPEMLPGLTEPTAGVPAVPDGAVIVTELSDEVVAVVNV
jgi:hypothetical protein